MDEGLHVISPSLETAQETKMNGFKRAGLVLKGIGLMIEGYGELAAGITVGPFVGAALDLSETVNFVGEALLTGKRPKAKTNMYSLVVPGMVAKGGLLSLGVGAESLKTGLRGKKTKDFDKFNAKRKQFQEMLRA